MKLFRAVSPNIGTADLIVKASTPKQASRVARDVIRENRMTHDAKILIYVTELVQPDDDRPGYCYLINSVNTFEY
jgi:hypothetical protein